MNKFLLGGAVFFVQERVGKDNKLFKIYKFRTMEESSLPEADRLTGWGRFLRKTSLDELPELWNIFKGDMSFVGPRPLLPEYIDRYSNEQARRHTVMAGLTGWAQVNGRNGVTWEERFEYDIWYVENASFWLDIKILFMTFFVAWNPKGGEFMEPFKGNRDE